MRVMYVLFHSRTNCHTTSASFFLSVAVLTSVSLVWVGAAAGVMRGGDRGGGGAVGAAAEVTDLVEDFSSR